VHVAHAQIIGRGSRALFAVGVVAGCLGTAGAEASTGSGPRDGYYAPLATETNSADVELFVIDNGQRVADTEKMPVGLSCDQNTAEQAEGLNPGASYVNVYIPFGVKLAIKGRSFSYSGAAYLLPSEVPSGVTQPAGTITISGTFKPASQVTGKKVDKKAPAFTGSVSATLCTTIPPTFADYWSRNDH
jgi:hypothetical protein